MSDRLPDGTEQQLRRYLQRQHRADPTPGQTWAGVAARLAATTEGQSPVPDTPQAMPMPSAQPVTLSEQQRMQQGANPPRRGFLASAAGLAAVILFALLARAVFTRGPANNATSSYRQVPSLVMSGLSDVSMVSANDGWAVGSAYTLTEAQEKAGTTPPTVPLLFHYTGRAWQAVAVPEGLAGSDLHTVVMLSAQDGWAAGGYNEDPPRFGGHVDAPGGKLAVLLHYDGRAWQSISLSYTKDLTITQLVRDAAGDVWAMATSANYDGHVEILHEHAGTWTVAHDGTYGGFISVGNLSMGSATDGWATISYLSGTVSEGGPSQTTLLHLQNGVWTTLTTYPDTTLYHLVMLSAQDGWAAGTSVKPTDKTATPTAVLLHFTNGTWQPVPHPTADDGATIVGILTFSDPTHGWFMGKLGTSDTATYGYYTFDGKAWKNAHITSKGYFGAASFSSPSDGWFVGDGATNESLPNDGTISYGFAFAHYHNGTWTETMPSKDGK